MGREVVATANAPAAIGPYSQGIRMGDLVFTAGQLGVKPGTKELVGPDIQSQTRQVLENVQAILEAGGSCLDHVIKTTVYLLDMQDFALMNEVYAQFFTDCFPVRSTVQVAALPLGGRVEIDVIAEFCDCGTREGGRCSCDSSHTSCCE